MTTDRKMDELRGQPSTPIKFAERGDAALTQDELKQISGGTDSASPKLLTINWGDGRKV
jgi:bacteriocin-like protein